MKSKFLLTAVAAAAGMVLNTRADFFDNFDGYANQAAFNAVWTANVGGTILGLESTTNFSAPNAIQQTTTALAQVNHLMTPIQGKVMDFSFKFFDNGGSRDFAQVYSRVGTAFTSGLNGALSLGTFNTTVGGRYAARFSAATPANGAVFGDGATIISTSDTTGWFALSITKTPGAWHTMEIVGGVDPSNSSRDIFKFYVDGVLGGSVANAPDFAFNFAVLGGNNSTTVSGAAYDDYSITTIPEPSSFALLTLSGLALTAGRLSRRGLV